MNFKCHTVVFLVLSRVDSVNFSSPEVLGVLSATGQSLDLVAFLVLTMSVGFAVEYVAHIAYAFAHAAVHPNQNAPRSVPTYWKAAVVPDGFFSQCFRLHAA